MVGPSILVGLSEELVESSDCQWAVINTRVSTTSMTKLVFIDVCFLTLYIFMLQITFLPIFRLKFNPKTYHNMMVFGHRYTGPEAESVGLIDKAVPPHLVESESQMLLKKWLGKEGFPRESLQNMKKDAYSDALKDLCKSRRQDTSCTQLVSAI